MTLLSVTCPPWLSFPISVFNLSTCPTPWISSLAQGLPLAALRVEFSGVVYGSIINVSVKITYKCRSIYFCSLISICCSHFLGSHWPTHSDPSSRYCWEELRVPGVASPLSQGPTQSSTKATSICGPVSHKWKNILKPQASLELNIYSFPASYSVHRESSSN